LANLTKEQIVTIEVIHQRGQSATHTARLLGVTEGTVCSRRRARDGAVDVSSKRSPDYPFLREITVLR
jgi:hypothetical protein